MKLVIFADGVVGLSIAQYLIESYPEDLSLVVTTQINKIHCEAEERGIPVCIFDTADGVMSKLPDGVDLGVLAWWPNILKSPLLEAPRHGWVNTHPSLLPYNRGKHYNFWALVEQAPFGVTLHRVDSGVDTGEIVAQQAIPYDWRDNGGTLYAKAQGAMASLFCQTYSSLRTGQFDSKPQDRGLGSFHHSSEIEQASHIDLDRMYRGRHLINLLRARTFEGYPGCWFEEDGNRYEISIRIRKLNQ
ncbi:MAG: Linear gramicidin synthase subunit A [Nitrosomonadaceae bacterium]|nr:Linear gramicidin synthase subunit A [Nitrosomonadaceae bacterium]